MPWTIDNKYYTASVTFEPRPLSIPVAESYPVLLYVFAGQVRPPSPSSVLMERADSRRRTRCRPS